MPHEAPDRENLEYICNDVPRFEELSYPGQRYEAFVPDTLDLQDRAALGINGVTGPTDPEADHEMYFLACFGRNPPTMEHDLSTDCQGKLQESLPLLRLASGSDFNSHVDRCWMEVTLKMRGPDGLLYNPVKGRPWYGVQSGKDMRPAPEIAKAGHVGNPVHNGRMLGALSLYYLLTGDELWVEVGRRIVEGLGGIVEYHFWPGGPRSTEAPTGAANPWVLQGLCQFYRVTGHEPALELARRCVGEMKKQPWIADGDSGPFLGGEVKDKLRGPVPFGWSAPPGYRPHFHSTVIGLLSLMEYATIVGDGDLMAQVCQGYEYAKLLGETTVGFFPERVANLFSTSIADRADFRYDTSETCEVADMIAVALKLTEAGQGDYWDDVDRWLRNQFAEAQLTDVEWVHRMTEDLPKTSHNPMNQTTDRVPERCVGTFAGWPSVNDWYTWARHSRHLYPEYPGQAIMQCCGGNGTRAIYYAWERILDFRDGTLRVNLLLNRASPWADVDSHIPYEGRVDVKVKEACELMVRIPEWASPDDTLCQVNDEPRLPEWDGRYARVGRVQAGDLAAVSFPIPTRSGEINVTGSYYKVVRKGNEVVTIDPPGKFCPFYQRAHYRTSSTRWKKATRFVADKSIHW